MSSLSTPRTARPPVALTSLVGREREIADLTALLKTQRLVTLTGVGGSGKTRLAAELALRVEWQEEDSAAWVQLATCADAPSVAAQIARALAVRLAADSNPTDALIEALRNREVLLVLDDCERAVQACADLARALLVDCPDLRIIATSREPLGVAGEHVWPVPQISTEEAVQLFCDRAKAVDPHFSPDKMVTEVCERLDRIPLAIELAAARVRVLTAAEIAARLEDRFAILTGGARTAEPRHRTLRAAIDWSFELLSPREQTLLARLSVFAGSFTMRMAATVCDADLDLLTSLVDKSLLVVSRRSEGARYHLLETIRQYAAERLAEIGETNDIRRRHAVAYLEFARQAVVDPMGAIIDHLSALDTEHDNVRVALAWSIEHEPDAIALPLGAAFRWYWYYRIAWAEGLRWLLRVIERSRDVVSVDRAGVHAAAGAFATYVGEGATGIPLLRTAESLWRQLGANRELALSLSTLAQALVAHGDLDDAARHAAESIALARAHGTSWDIAYCLTNAVALVAERGGDLDAADRALEEAESIWTSCRHPLGYPFVLSARARIALARHDLDSATRFARAALVEARAAHELWFCARATRILASTAAPHDAVRAARLLGAAEAMLRTIGARTLVHERRQHDQLLETLRDTLGSDDLETAMSEGAAMPFSEACEFALQAAAEEPPDRETLLIEDLGPLQITIGGRPLPNEGRASNRARELLVFLASNPMGATKEQAGLAFWPDATTEQVKNSFHVTLHRLRKMLGGAHAIASDGPRYRIAIPHVTLSRKFESDTTAALKSSNVAALQTALAMYRGEFLHGEEAGEWCQPVRSHLQQLYLRALFALGKLHERDGRFAEAAEAYTRLLRCDPFHEAGARQLMICRARLGARSESLLVYRELEQRLRDDLDAEPEPETRTLYSRLRQNESV